MTKLLFGSTLQRKWTLKGRDRFERQRPFWATVPLVSHAVIYVTFIYQQRSSAVAAAAAKTSGLPYSTGVKIDSWLSSNTAEISLKCLTCCNKLGATISYICSPPTTTTTHPPCPTAPSQLTVLDVFLKPYQMLCKLLKKKKEEAALGLAAPS